MSNHDSAKSSSASESAHSTANTTYGLGKSQPLQVCQNYLILLHTIVSYHLILILPLLSIDLLLSSELLQLLVRQQS